MAENAARLACLHKQKKFLRQRTGEMICRGLSSLDELNAAEEKERQEKLSEELCSADLGKASFSVADPFFSDLAVPSLGNPF
ncbi:hypothetical protein B7463_g10235, partial [Scytalidium lignicola]